MRAKARGSKRQEEGVCPAAVTESTALPAPRCWAPAFRAVRQCISILRRLALGTLLWKSQGVNTDG